MKEPVFDRYSDSQQANSLKMRVNWIVAAVAAHEVKGRKEGRRNVGMYRQRVIRHLNTIIRKLQRGDCK